jgi:hypothetical protein
LTPAQFGTLRTRLELLASSIGKDLKDFSIGCGSLVNIQPDPATARAEAEAYVRRYWPETYGPRSFDRLISGPPAIVAEGILKYWEAGCRHIAVRVGALNYEAQVPLLLDEVMPAVWEGVRARPRSA